MKNSGAAELGEYGRRFSLYQNLRPADWVEPDSDFNHNVLIAGGGHNGSALSFALSRRGIGGVGVIDAASEGKTGIWLTTARMHTLRTPKNLVGPDLGFLPLSFPAWFEALHGARAFEAVNRIQRTDWGDYLLWFNKEAGIKIRHGTRLIRIEPRGRGFRVILEADGNRFSETARKVVMANGIAGTGAPHVPSFLTDNLPDNLYVHTSRKLEDAEFKGKVVAVVGAAASAFDAAAVALEAGASHVHLICRRKELTATVMNRHRAYPGAVDRFYRMPDDFRWRLINMTLKGGLAPPEDSVLRATRHSNFHLHLLADFSTVTYAGGRVRWRVASEHMDFDFVIAATGYLPDPRLSPELAGISQDIALWGDRYVPPGHEQNSLLATYPYVGPRFEFTEKNPGDAPWLANLHCYTNSASMSFGRSVGDVPTMNWGINHLADALADDLFFQDIEKHEARMSKVPTQKEYSEEIYRKAIYSRDENERKIA